jgi:hypothetical protein
VINQVNGFYDVAKTDSRAGAIDASVLCTPAGRGAEQAGNLEKATPEKFLRRLLGKYKYGQSNNIKWKTLAEDLDAAGVHCPAPAVSFLLGAPRAPPAPRACPRAPPAPSAVASVDTCAQASTCPRRRRSGRRASGVRGRPSRSNTPIRSASTHCRR